MKIKLSRHAKRRAKLYNISTSAIMDILTSMSLDQGKQEIIRDIVELQYPLKIVVSVEKDIATVITNYPLKKGKKR